MTAQSVHDDTNTTNTITRFLPFMDWLFHYRRENLTGDLIAGIVVAVMLVPQGMAYALLAGLSPQQGLYASILPLMIYGLLGSSGTLSVGPTAVSALLVASGVSQFAEVGTSEYVALALLLALMVGVIQMVMSLLKAGFLVNFLSHPVLAGFTSAAAIVISISQLKHVLGIDMPRFEHFYESILHIISHLGEINPATLILGMLSIITLVYFRSTFKTHLQRFELPESVLIPLTKIGPLFVVIMGTVTVWAFGMDTRADVGIVGTVPAGLPDLTFPQIDLNHIQMLLPTALTISLIGFTESISVAKSLASKRRRRLSPNQELMAIGAANFSASLTGAYPVSGGLSRSVVNFSAGANTGLASIITGGLIALTVTFLMPLFFYLPQATLAAIIIVAVTKLFDLDAFINAWRYNHSDALSMLVTFFAVLVLGIETGIVIGVAVAIALYLWRTSQPHIAVVGRVGDTEHFRNVQRHKVHTIPSLMIIRIDESLYFANTRCLESEVLNAVADNPEVDHLVLMCSAVNFIDSSALSVLEKLIDELHDSGVTLYLSEVKGPVMDGLREIGFIDRLGEDRVFLSTHEAMCRLEGV